MRGTTKVFSCGGIRKGRSAASALRCVAILVLASALVPLCTQLVLAQTSGTGALAGTITDSSGAAIAAADVKTISQSSGEVRSVMSAANGKYSVPLLLPGAYRVEVSKAGFKTTTYPHVEVVVTETDTLNVRMEVGQVIETVTVTGEASQLNTEDSALGKVTTSLQVEALPLAVRNYTQIIALNPGVASELTNAGELGRGGGGNVQDPTVSNGTPAFDNNFEMNGVGVNDVQQGGNFSSGVAIPNPDTIQEFKVQTGQYDASYGRNAGANVNVITKGGTNEFHGAVWEYIRNDALNANTYFLNANGQPRAVLKQNQFGGDFGGPIVKDKLQFFTSYQGTRQRNGLDPNCSANFTEAPITNDRSAAALGQLFVGQSGFFGGEAILADGSNINPVALALLNRKQPDGSYMIPTPQRVDLSQSFDSQGSLAISKACPFTEDQFMTNADYEASQKSTFSARFFFANSDTTNTMPTTNLTGGPSPPGFPVNLTQDFRNFSLTHTYVFTPTLVNQAEVGFHRIFTSFAQSRPFKWSDVGVTVVPSDDPLPALAIDALGTGGLSLGGDGETVIFAQNAYTLQDSLSWTHGKHNFRFGGGLSREQDNEVGFSYLSGEAFVTWADFLLGKSGADNGSGASNLFASVDLLGLFDRAYRAWEIWGYGQDDIKVTDRLTLNLGFRYDHIGDFADALGRNAGFDFSKADPNPPPEGSLAGTTVPNNYTGPMPPGVTRLSNSFGMNGVGQNTWNPRLGFAYRLPYTERLVLRGGYGVYHSRTSGQSFVQTLTTPPYSQIRSFVGFAPPGTGFSEQQPLPLDSPTFPAFVPYSPTTSNTIYGADPNFRPPMIQQYSLGVQAQLSSSLVLDVGYSGARGLHMISVLGPNQANIASASHPIRGETTNTIANLGLRVPVQGFDPNSTIQLKSTGASWYNALLVGLNKRFSHGLQFQASYTFSKSLSNVTSGTTAGAQSQGSRGNQNDPRSRYGPDDFIRPHRLIVNYSYELPKLQGSSAFLRQGLGGWSLQGVTTFQTGHYLSVYFPNTTSVYGIQSDRAQLSGTCTPSQYVTGGSLTSKLGNYINANCFTSPPIVGDPEPPGTCGLPDPTTPCPASATAFGNSGVGILRGPSELNFDFSVIKHFPVSRIKDKSDLEFRAEFFNIFNHPLFADPDITYGDTNFGRISTNLGNPRIVQFALKLVF
jgi:hypothetical protein